MEPIFEIIVWLAIIVIGFFALMFLTGAVVVFMERQIIPSRYEWLSVLSHYEWKEIIQMTEEMRKLKKTTSVMAIIYVDLKYLEMENLVESRLVAKKRINWIYINEAGEVIGFTEYRKTVFEYRLTPSGTRKKNKILQEEQESVLPEDAQTA